MRQTLTPRTSRLLDIQGFDTVDVQELARVAVLAAASPVHPFDLAYNYGIRALTGTGPLPPARDAQQEG